MQGQNLYGFSPKGRLRNSPYLDTFVERLAQFMLTGPETKIDAETKRRIALLAGISLVGAAALAFFALLATIQGNVVLGVLDISMSIILLTNLQDARLNGRYPLNITLGTLFTSIFYIYLYITGGVNQTAYVWYFTYPLIAMFLLGSKNGAIATLLMTLPVMGMMVFSPEHQAFATYHIDFEIRFLFSYLVVGLFSFFIENAAEKNRHEINQVNRNLEDLIAERTEALVKKVEQLKKVQHKLFQSETRYRKMFEKSVNAVFLVDAQTGRYLDVNPAAEKLTGRNKNTLLTLTTADVTPDAIMEKLNNLRIPDGTLEMSQVRYLRPDGSERAALLNGVQIDDNLLMGIAQDITDLKRAESERSLLTSQLHQAKKMEALGTMAGGVAHDLNNILAGIVSYPQIIRSQLNPDSSLESPLRTMEEAGKRAATVVNDLLTLSRNAASAKQDVNIHHLISTLIDSPEWLNIQEQHPDITFTMDLDARRTTLSCSPVHMRKCIMNLLHNGYEAAAPDGQVILRTKNCSTLPSDVHIEHDGQPGEFIQITVEDDGTGIDVEHIEHIFEPFYTTKKMGRSGTGLGLSVVWNTINEHQGVITVRNCSPGASFEIWLPVTSVNVEEVRTDNTPCKESYHGEGNILIVDDEQQLREIASSIVEMFGYSATSVATGEEALEKTTLHHYDMILLDMFLGKGMNGLETYRAMLEHNPTQKAVIISGYATSKEVREALELGASSIIMKPYNMEDIGQALKENIEAPHLQQ